MNYDIQAFESIGANCEFGFFLKKKGNDLSTLLKWVEVLQVRKLTTLFTEDFRNLLEYDNIRPFNRSMVLDRLYMMAWHTALHSDAIDKAMPASGQNLQFIASQDEVDKIWREQKNKVKHLVDRTREGLRSAKNIYVFKPRIDDPMTEARMLDLHNALNLYGRNRLLIVTLADEVNPTGSVKEVCPDLMHGFVDRFAPGDNTSNFSETAWNSICENAYKILVSTQSKSF